MKKIYLDYAATTPVDKEVLKTMLPYFSEKFGNPGSLHSYGQEAMAAIDEAREKISRSINADFQEIIFTGSATEANNLALRGVVKNFYRFRAVATQNQNNFAPAAKFSSPSARQPCPASGAGTKLAAPAGCSSWQSALNQNNKNFLPPKIIISSIEHESILETCRDLEKEGIEIIYLPVNKQGIVDLEKLKKSLNEQTILISIMCANNEIGTIQNIPKIAEIIKQFKEKKSFTASIAKERLKNSSAHSVERQDPEERSDEQGGEQRNERIEFLRSGAPTSEKNFFSKFPLFHTDAIQAFQFLDCDVEKLGIDLMTLSAHKIYGPKGIGALYVKNLEFRNQNLEIKNKKILNPQSSILNPIIAGGGQEFDLRSGTENVAAIVGFAKAVELAAKNREKESKRIGQLTDYFWKKIKKIFPKAEINGVSSIKYQVSSAKKLPNILNIYFPGRRAEDLSIKLDLADVAVSSGAACSARAMKPSYVLKAIGLTEQKIKNSLRFSFGKFTTKEEINKVIKIIKSAI